MTANAEKIQYTCAATGATANGKPNRLPRGWKRLPGGEPVSPGGWARRYALRCLTIAVKPEDDDWPALRERLRGAWSESTALANWALRHLYAADFRRTPDMKKCPPPPKVYLYGAAKAEYPRWSEWDGAKGAANAVLRRAESRWRDDRYKVLWLGKDRPPVYGDPQPYPLDADQWQVWRADEAEGGHYLASAALPGGRVRLRLRTSRQRGFKRLLKQLCAGQVVPAEAAILRKRANTGDHRNGESASGPSGKQQYDVCLKIVGYWPREEQSKPKEKTLWVSTQPDCLLSVLDEDRNRLWTANYDWLRTKIVGWDRRMQRLREDAKAERRKPKAAGEFLSREREAVTLKRKQTTQTALHQLSREVVEFARRCRATKIEYNDSDQSYIRSFPWFQFRQQYLAPKMKEVGIELVHVASGDLKPKD